MENYLRRAFLPITPNSVCRKFYPVVDTNKQLCAGREQLGKGTCNVSS